MENDQLWGLIACHHQSARHTTLAIREAAIFISRMASTKLNSLAALEHGNLIGQALLINGEILKYIPVENEGALLRRLLPKLRQLLHASGIIMVVQGRRYDQGEVPPAETLDGLLTWLSTQPVSETFSCDFLAKLYPPAAAFQEIASGLIATSLSGDMKNCIVWLRGEKARNIHWAGKYTEGLKQDAAGSYYLTPRSSFEALTELWRGHCEPWSPAEIGIVLLLANSLSEGLLQKSLREMELNQQKIANAELLMALEASRNEDQVMVQKLSLAVEQSSASIVITDLAAKIEYVNNAFLKISGFTREEVLGRNPNFLQSGKTPKATYQTLWSTLTRGETWVGELINRRKDGSEFVESALISPVRQTDGSITHYLAIKENITEHKRHAKQLEEAKEKAEMANRAKSAFLANMSHEIRTPMNGVIGLSELALESFDAVEKQGYLRQILESSKSLMGILNDILDLSKIEAQQVTIEYNVFNLAEMLDGLKQMFSLRAHEKSLEFMLVCAPEIPNFLIGDELRLRQILTNLLSNSLKFTERGHITLNVCQIAGQDNASTIRFSVMDSGIGMTFEQIGKLFQPFAQADNSITRRFGGTGLGLTISRNLAQLMGGDIQVESTEGAGSKFHLQVKLDKADAGEIERLNTQHQADLMQPNSYTATRVLRGKEVLLAEDNTVNQLVASKMLTKHGLRVDIANNGEEALRCLDRKYYDVVLMDIQMPVMDGLEATRLIRENPRFSDLPIVAMSAGVTLDEQEMCNQAGMTAFIGKPIDSNELIKKLIELLTFGNATEPNEQAAASSADKFNLSGFDNQRLAELTELFGETDSVIELISDFRNDFIGTTELIKDMLNRGDLISACKKAHSIKGSSSNLGAVEISAAASDLEEKLKLGEEASLELKRLTQAWELFMSQTIATV
jgi:PAS domain S-box-containing protein